LALPDSRARLGLLLGFIVNASASGLHAQVAGPSPHPNFIFFRYASLTSLSLYGAYGEGKWLGFFGMVQNPRTSYREIVGGVGANVVVTPRVGGAIALAAADASDGWYGQLYLQSNMRLGRVRTYLSTAYYEPLDANGVRQVKVNPALVMWRAFRGMEAGGAYVFLGSAGSKGIHQLGPALQMSVPNGRASFELLKRLHDSRTDLRVTFQAYL
jgi:hypothetical protein